MCKNKANNNKIEKVVIIVVVLALVLDRALKPEVLGIVSVWTTALGNILAAISATELLESDNLFSGVALIE